MYNNKVNILLMMNGDDLVFINVIHLQQLNI